MRGEKRRDLLKVKPRLAGCGSRGPKARAGGFRPCSNYFSPQTTEAAQGPGARHDFQIKQPPVLNHMWSKLCSHLFRPELRPNT